MAAILFFSNESKKIVMLMAYLKLMGVDSLPERKIYDIIPDSTPHHVCAVLDSSLIYREMIQEMEIYG